MAVFIVWINTNKVTICSTGNNRHYYWKFPINISLSKNWYSKLTILKVISLIRTYSFEWKKKTEQGKLDWCKYWVIHVKFICILSYTLYWGRSRSLWFKSYPGLTWISQGLQGSIPPRCELVPWEGCVHANLLFLGAVCWLHTKPGVK